MNVLMYTNFNDRGNVTIFQTSKNLCHPQVTNFSQVTNFQFMQYAILCCTCGNYNFLNYNSPSFDLSHLYNICTHTHTHTHTNAKSCVLMKTSDLIKIMGKLRERN